MPTTTDEWGNVIEEHPGGQATFDGKTLQEHLAAGTLPKGWYLGLYGEPRAKFSGYSEGQTAIVNQGHFFAYVVGGEVKGEYYPGYSSSGRPAGGIGEIQPILDQIRMSRRSTPRRMSPTRSPRRSRTRRRRSRRPAIRSVGARQTARSQSCRGGPGSALMARWAPRPRREQRPTCASIWSTRSPT
jgi:hypothetical protein